MSIEEAIRQFREAAIEKGDFCTPAKEDRRLYGVMAESVRFLKTLGFEGHKAFEALLKDPSPHVRSWAAAELLTEGDISAKAVLKALAREPGLLGFTAQMTLDVHSRGELRSMADYAKR